MRGIDVNMRSVIGEEGGFDLDILRINHRLWHKPTPTDFLISITYTNSTKSSYRYISRILLLPFIRGGWEG
jgi:hypothetical protein